MDEAEGGCGLTVGESRTESNNDKVASWLGELIYILQWKLGT